jgi:3-oxoacyl-[acyl-carrier-protein] synthase II
MPVIAGYGLLTPLGATAGETWNALVAGRAISDHAKVEAFNGPARSFDMASRVAQEAIGHARWGTLSADDSTALIVATSKGPVENWLAVGAAGLGTTRRLSVSSSFTAPPGQFENRTFGLAQIATHLADEFHLSGPRLTLSAACASGLHGLIRASMMIESGEVRRAIVVAVEASVHPLFLANFERLGVLAPAGRGCRPFDLHREGFLMSEAAAAVCLERDDEFSPGNTRIDRYALGGDATHLTGGDPDGQTLRYLFRRVMDGRRVELIHAHGTGTVLNDTVELNAIEAVTESVRNADPTGALESHRPPVALYSHKGALGHSLGASGLVSVVINCIAQWHGVVPGNVNTSEPMRCKGVEIGRHVRKIELERSVAIATGFGGPTAVIGLASDR